MFVNLIVLVPLLLMTGVLIYIILGKEFNGLNLLGLLIFSLFEMFFLYFIVYSFKQFINPTLLITVNETGIIVGKDKKNVEIGWEDIESYMICGKFSSPGGIVYFYIFLKDGIASTTIPKELKIEYHYMKNPKKLKSAFDENKIKELPPDLEVVKNIK